MKQIKMFSAKSTGSLEDKVNEFLSEISESNIVDIKISEVGGWFTATVVYLSENKAERSKDSAEYHNYQLEWCKQHDVTLEDIVAKAINNYAICEEAESTRDDIVQEVMEMIEETGFNGECYICFNEWKDNEGAER